MSRNSNKSIKVLSILAFAVALVVGVSGYMVYAQQNNNPLPDDIKNQVGIKVIFPSQVSKIDEHSYYYQKDQKTLGFKAESFGTDIVFVEQPAPANAGTGDQVYYPALGIHPYAQFQSKAGPVALAKFWLSKTLESNGQTAVLIKDGTLVTARPAKDLSNSQWKELFDSLKITK